MLSALCERLLKRPDMLSNEFDTLVIASKISKTLRRAGWTKKTTRHIAGEWNADLRDYYLHKMSLYQSYHLVYVDESRYDPSVTHTCVRQCRNAPGRKATRFARRCWVMTLRLLLLSQFSFIVIYVVNLVKSSNSCSSVLLACLVRLCQRAL